MDFDDISASIITNWKKIGAAFLVLAFIFWAITYSANPTEQNLQKGTALIEKASVPFWLKPFELLSKSESIISAIATIILLIMLLRYAERSRSLV